MDLRAAGFPIVLVSVGSTPTLCAAERLLVSRNIEAAIGDILILFYAWCGSLRDRGTSLSPCVLCTWPGRGEGAGCITVGGWARVEPGTAARLLRRLTGVTESVCDIQGELILSFGVASREPARHGIIARQ